MSKRALAACLAALGGVCFAVPVVARDSLGVFDRWAAFRDPRTPRCYAIAAALPTRTARGFAPYASVGTWPKRRVFGQLHVRLSRRIAADTPITLAIGRERHALVGGSANAWAKGKAGDAAIAAAMRSAERMTVTAVDTRGRRFSDRYLLSGAATAMDAAAIGCARLGR